MITPMEVRSRSTTSSESHTLSLELTYIIEHSADSTCVSCAKRQQDATQDGQEGQAIERK